MLEVWVVSPVEKANTLSHGSPALFWKSNRELDHIRGLSVAQLRIVPLVCINTKNVHRHVDRRAANLLCHFDDRDAQDYVELVLRFEVRGDGDLLALVVRNAGPAVIRIGELGFIRIHRNDFVNNPLCRRVGVSGRNTNFPKGTKISPEDRTPPVALSFPYTLSKLWGATIEYLADSLEEFRDMLKQCP